LNFQNHPPDTLDDLQNQLLWMNSEITIGDQPLLWNICIQNGLIFVNDFLDTSGHFI